MADTKYTYTISTGTANGKVDNSSLMQEIRSSAILTAFKSMNTSGDSIDIWFRAALSTSAPDDKTILDGILTAHTGVAATKIQKTKEVLEPEESTTPFLFGTNGKEVCTKTTDTEFTFDILADRIKACRIECDNNVFGDHIKVEIIDDASPTPNVLMSMADNFPIPKSGIREIESKWVTDKIPANSKLRVKYTSIGVTNDVDVIFDCEGRNDK